MARIFATASKSFNKFALFANLGILGWSILQRSDWLIRTLTKMRTRNLKKSGVQE